MTETKKILWPTIFSQSCSVFLPRICEMAQKYDAEIEVLYIGRDQCGVEPFYGKAGEDHIKKHHDWEIKRSMKRLDDACGQKPDQCPSVTKKAVLGDAYREIMTAIETDNIDIVFFAAQGSGTEKHQRLQLGGVADKVIKNSPVPVLTVNPGIIDNVYRIVENSS